MLYSTPNSAIKIIIDVFPLETNGKGKPVGGMLPVTTSAFIIACMPNIKVTPTAIKYPKTSFEREAIPMPRNTMKAIRAKKNSKPINPVSSPITDKIKSDSLKGWN